MDTYFAAVDIVPEVVKFYVQVFGSRPVFVVFSHLHRATVVFEHLAEYFTLCVIDWETVFAHFLHRLNYRNGVPQGIRESGILTLG